MASNLFGPNTMTGRTAQQIKAKQDAARAADAQRERTAAAAGRDRRSIGTTR
jgi:hypothetical protein